MSSAFDTPELAAAAALAAINKMKKADKREYIGLIYQDPDTGKYLYTEPQTANQEGKTKGKFSIPKGTLAGIIHNHPKGGSKHRDRLSEDDVAMSIQLGVPSFIGVDNRLFRWSPQGGKVRRNHGLAEEVVLAPFAEAEASNKQPTISEMFTGNK